MPRKVYRRIFFTIVLSFMILASFGLNLRLSFGSQATGTGVIVPLYEYPGQSWQTLAQTKEAYPSVPVVAIINPSNGPGSYQDPNFVSGIQLLQSAGITVIGYVATDYGGIPISQVEQEIYSYSQFYNLNGVFFDEMASVSGYESYYSTLSSYAQSLGLSFTVGNPGTAVPASYIGTVDNIVVYENAGLPPQSFLSGLGYQKNDFSVMSYGDSSFDSASILATAADVGYVFVTDGISPDPYATLGSYYSTLIATLASSPSVTVTVDSFDLYGNQLPGLWTTIQSNGQVIASGFTPFSFSAVASSTYTVTIYSFGSYSFDYWATGSYSPSISITPTTSSELAAFYST